MIEARLKGVLRLAACYALLIAGVQGQTARLRVAVYPFDQSTVQTSIQKEVGGNVNYGQVASQLLIGELASQVDVIDRDQMSRLLAEQGRRYDEHFDPSQAPEFGKLLGVDAIITGSITAVHADQQVSTGVGGLANAAGQMIKIKRPKLDTSSTTVKVQIEVAAEMISTVTGKILTAGRGEGALKKQISGKLQINNQGTSDTSGSKSGYDPYVREALLLAVKDVGGKFADAYTAAPRASGSSAVSATPTSVPPKPTEPKEPEYVALPDEVGNVFRTDGETMTFFVAPGAKIVVGDVLEVQHAEVTKHPRTGKLIAVGQTLGSLKVSEVSADSGKGKYQGKPATDQDRLVKSATASKAAQGQDGAPKKKTAAKQ